MKDERVSNFEVALNGRPLSYVENDIEFAILTRSYIVPALETRRVESVDLCKPAKHLQHCREKERLLERVVQHLFPVALSCDKTKPAILAKLT